MAFVLHDVPGGSTQPLPIITQEFAGLAVDTLTPDVLVSLPVHDIDEYDAMYLDLSGLHTSVHWHAHSQPVNVAALPTRRPTKDL